MVTDSNNLLHTRFDDGEAVDVNLINVQKQLQLLQQT